MISANLDSVNIQSVSALRKLLGKTTLAQLRIKKEQISKLDNAIGAKIEVEQEFKEEITNVDTYQVTLDKQIAFLAEFVRKDGLIAHAAPVRADS